MRYAGFGYARFGGAVRRRFSAGRNSSNLPAASFRQSRSCIRSRCTALTPEPKGGARCVSSARRDLRGGRGAILVSTATSSAMAAAGEVALKLRLGALLPLFRECELLVHGERSRLARRRRP